MSGIVLAADEGVHESNLTLFKSGVVIELPSGAREELFTGEIDPLSGFLDARFNDITVYGKAVQAHDVIRYFWHKSIVPVLYSFEGAYPGIELWSPVVQQEISFTRSKVQDGLNGRAGEALLMCLTLFMSVSVLILLLHACSSLPRGG
jgi:hypothetical protein